MKILKRLKELPLIGDCYGYFWGFARKAQYYRGVYNSFEAALEAVPKSGASGYGQPIITTHPDPAQLSTGKELEVFNQRDYPILVWLARAFETGSTVFDLGGNVGTAYYAYRKFVNFPKALQWTVCELPEFCRRGEQIAKERGLDCLHFTEDFRQADGAQIFLTCGTLQYLEKPLSAMLSRLAAKPRHLIIQRVPLYDGPSFYTVQNIGYAFCAYHIQNKRDLFESLSRQGYRLIDSWSDSRTSRIPFHPARTVTNYYGAYFQRDVS